MLRLNITNNHANDVRKITKGDALALREILIDAANRVTDVLGDDIEMPNGRATKEIPLADGVWLTLAPAELFERFTDPGRGKSGD